MILPKFSFGTELCLGEGSNSGPSFSNALSTDFDGSTNKVVFSAVSALNLSQYSNWAFSCWLKTSASQVGAIAGNWEYTPSAERQWLAFMNANGTFTFFLSTNGSAQTSYTTGATWNDGAWHHLVCTYQTGSVPVIYKDGSSTSHGSGTPAPALYNVVNPMVFGCVGDAGSTQHYLGRTDEVSIWTKTLSSGEVSEIYNSGAPTSLTSHSAAANLLGWWRMGDGDTYPTISDNSSNSNNGTMTNMASGDFVADAP